MEENVPTCIALFISLSQSLNKQKNLIVSLFSHNFLCRAVLVADDVQAFLGLGQAPAVK